MKKNSVVIISMLVVFVIVVVITLNIAFRNRKYIDNSLTLEYLETIENKISNNKIIKIDEFEKFELDNTIPNGNSTTYLYNINDKYRVEIIAKNDIVVSIKVINKVTEVYIDMMVDSLEIFLIND